MSSQEDRLAEGLFITFEGGEGAGKSTQIALLARRFEQLGREVTTTREPGGSPGGEATRHVLLSGAAEPFGSKAESILFAAARADHVDTIIRPSVKAGKVVLCDRYIDSSRAYQGASGNLDPKFMVALETIAVDGMVPALTVILDLDPALGLARAAQRRGHGEVDRFEKETLDIHLTRREAFLQIAHDEPGRCAVVDASQSVECIEQNIWQLVTQRLSILEPSE